MTNKVLNLDFSKDPIMMPVIIYGRVGDDNSQTVTVNVTKRNEIFDLTGGSLTFEGVTKGGTTQVFDSDNISTTAEGLKKGTFDYTFPNAAFAVEGKYERAYFSFVKDGKRDTTSSFEIIVFGNADIDAEEAETIITEYNKLIEQLHELYQQTIDKVTGEYDQFHQQITKKMNEMETVIQNANADLTALKTKVDEIKQIIENLDNLYVMYSNSIDFGDYDYSGNPNLMIPLKASSFYTQSGVTIEDSGDALKVTFTKTDGAAFLESMKNVPALLPDTQYTLSADVTVMEGYTGKLENLRLGYRKSPNGTIILPLTGKDASVGQKTRIYTTANSSAATDPSKFDRMYFTINTTSTEPFVGTVLIENIKVEQGTNATPYQPNLLDDPYWLGKAPLGENIANKDVQFPITTTEYSVYSKANVEDYKVNQKYVLTMKATKPAIQRFIAYLNGGTIKAADLYPVEGLTDTWQGEFTVTQASIDAGALRTLAVYQFPSETKGTVKIEWIKLEKGNIRTPNIGEYKYRGTGMRDSNNPYDYVWDIEPSYVENNLATDIKVAEITGKANNYTDGKVAQVNSNLLTVINTLEKRVSTNSNNILDNTTKIGANTSSINTIRKSMPLFAVYGEGTDLSDVPTGTKLPIGALIATDFAHTASDLPYTISSDGNTLTATRNCVLLFEGSVKLHGNNTIKYAYVKIRKNGSDTNFANVGSSAALNYMTAQAGQYVHTLVTGDKVEFTVALDTAGKLFHTQLLSLKISEIKPV
ncbi:BppU family phage baseplate upper protein [Enterococcus faecium]|uniref:BppU family phage baseplate upper protein n=1 Tax=Enterococcus faecium TaxID=1352 RepID=A0AAW8RKM2_ENTFC|nr:BppU family phage baseplate upper protein [Enterococcus faecium]MDT2370632.1 BppU family phage baseplate upper protein [Enterococcus faecium]WCG21279.1 BppU family phage baseplate upper protein [Enterococcus faecium]HDI5795126.1 BppU family phage baseplate upper protein [Enterococcus faecium]